MASSHLLMRSLLLFLSSALFTGQAFGQGTWTTLNIPPSGRHDDVFFINDTVGWAAGGPAGTIRRTEDGGATWTLQYTAGQYLRSIEFIDAQHGYCGSLSGSLLRTVDGGATWTDVAPLINPQPPGICGLSAPTPTTIYGVGLWASPAYVVKSTDGGLSWSFINMSAQATALVDVHFISADTGFVTGTAAPAGNGGVILYTTDGGLSWQPKHFTGVISDIVWKIQRLDADHWYASVYSEPMNDDTRLLRSIDGGQTWSTLVAANSYTYVEVVGFMDTLRGWVGGGNLLYGTTDGGLTWALETVGNNYNRFFRLNDSLAYMSGTYIYKYSRDLATGTGTGPAVPEYHALNATPTVTDGPLIVDLRLDRSTIADLSVLRADGGLVRRLLHAHSALGEHRFSLDLAREAPGTYTVVLKTNEGLRYVKVVRR